LDNNGISGSASVTLNGTGSVTFNSPNTYTGATTINAGTLRINNANSLQHSTAVVNVNGGLVFGPGVGAFNVGALAGKGNVALTDSGSAAVNLVVGSNGASTNFFGNLTGAGSINKTGGGTLVLEGTNTYAGPTTISGGTLGLGFLVPSSIVVGNSGFTTGDTAGGFTNNPGGAGVAWTFTTNGSSSGISSNTTTSFAVVESPSGFAGVMQKLAAISQAISFPTAGTYNLSFYTEGRGQSGPDPFDVELNGANIVSVGAAGVVTPLYSAAFNQVTGTFTIPTPGSYTLSFVGTDPGGADLSSFITNVSIAVQAKLPATPLAIAAGATFDLAGTSQTVVSLSDVVAGDQGTVTTSLPFTAAMLTLTPSSGSTTFSGAIQDGSGTVGLTLNGAGTQVLAGVNGYTGGTTVSKGTLRVASTGTLGPGNLSIASAGTVTLQNAAQSVLALNNAGNLSLSGSLAVTAGMNLQAGSSTNFVLGAPNGYDGPALIATSGGASGSLAIDISGNSFIQFASPQAGVYDLFSYTGAPPNSFDLILGNDSILANPGYSFDLVNNTAQGQIDLIVTSASIFWTGASASWNTSANNWVNGTGAPTTFTDGGHASVTFGDTYPAIATLVGNSGGVATVTIQTGGVSPASVTFTNNGAAHGGVDYVINNLSGDTVGINGATGITLSGTGNVTLASQNSFSGAVNINAGQLILQATGALGSTSGVAVASGAALTLHGASVGAASLTLSGPGLASSPAGALNNASGDNFYGGSIALAANATINSATAGNTLTLTGGINNGGHLLTITGAGNTTVSSGSIIGGGGLTYSGSSAGTLNLAVGSTYSGTTAINSGNLLVTNGLGSSATGTGPVNVSAGATLGGSGYLGGLVSVAGGGILAPSAGQSSPTDTTLNFTNGLNLGDGSVLDFNLVSPTIADLVNVTGNLSLGAGILNINPFGGGTLSPGNYPLIDYSGVLTNDNSASWQVGSGGASTQRYSFMSIAGAGPGGTNQFDLVVTSASGSGEWIASGGNGGTLSYLRGLNWSGGTDPDGPGQSATFGTGNRTMVQIDGSYTIGSLNFTSGSAYSLSSTAASNVLTLNNGTGADAQINVADGGAGDFLYSQVNLASSTGNTTITVQPGSSLLVSSFNIQPANVGLAGSNQGIKLAGGGLLELAATNTYTGPTHVNSGTLLIDAGASIKSTAITVGVGSTLQLAGTTNALPDAANIVTTGGGPGSDGAVALSGAASESIGTITGDSSVNTDRAQVYTGATTVGDGSSAANLTATQILQNTLTINANSTVTIAPSAGAGGGVVPAASGASAASSTASADSGSDTSRDPFTAIEDAVASGSISSVKGQQLENRIAAIKRLAATDPALDASRLASEVLAALPSSSILPSTDASPLADTGSGLLTADGSAFGTGSSGSDGTLALAASFSGNPAAVPEPSTLLLAALAGIGLAFAARRRCRRPAFPG
jgi:autotransporter-associated beta strand protein